MIIRASSSFSAEMARSAYGKQAFPDPIRTVYFDFPFLPFYPILTQTSRNQNFARMRKISLLSA